MVIAIIAILAAMLLPAPGQGRTNRSTAACRQIGLALRPLYRHLQRRPAFRRYPYRAIPGQTDTLGGYRDKNLQYGESAELSRWDSQSVLVSHGRGTAIGQSPGMGKAPLTVPIRHNNGELGPVLGNKIALSY